VEAFLSERFGNYMEIPNIDQTRREQHAGVWDIEKNYDVYLKEKPKLPARYVL
jgi:hypothetical protein